MNDTGGEFSELVADMGTAATTYTDNTVAASLIPIVVGLVVSISSDGFAFNLPSGDEGSFLPLLLGFAITLLIWLGVFIWSLIWLISQGQAGPNRYGPDPRASDPTAQEELP